jgi:hypothetical protein
MTEVSSLMSPSCFEITAERRKKCEHWKYKMLEALCFALSMWNTCTLAKENNSVFFTWLGEAVGESCPFQ